jgi:hypothetical protein
MRTGTEEKTPIVIRPHSVEAYLRRAFGDDARLIGLCDIAAPANRA